MDTKQKKVLIVSIALVGTLSVIFILCLIRQGMNSVTLIKNFSPKTTQPEKDVALAVDDTSSNDKQTLIDVQSDWQIFSDTEYGYEIKFPSGWKITQRTSSASKSDLEFILALNGITLNGDRGTIEFGKYSIYNDSISNSIEDNINLLNTKKNILGSKSTFKEVVIDGGRAFYNPTQTSISPKEREFFVIGRNVIFSGTFQTSAKNISKQELEKFAEILSKFKFLQ